MINRIGNNYSYIPRVEHKAIHIRPEASNVLSFKASPSVTLGKMPDDITIEDLDKYENDAIPNNVLQAVYDAKYCSKIYIYKSPISHKNYAIKRLCKDGLNQEQIVSLAKQLELEANAHKELYDANAKVPRFYYYQGDFSGTEGSEKNNFIIMDRVKGKNLSLDSTSYDFYLMNNKDLGEIYEQIHAFDKKGILHNDLWSANILFNKEGIKIIDFNRIERFDPVKYPLKTNLDSFKERFLWRYFSDLYHNSDVDKIACEKELLDVYKFSIDKELELLNKKAQIIAEQNKPLPLSLSEQIQNLSEINSKPELLKSSALNTVYNSDLRCGRIYSQYFEFEDKEAQEVLTRALKIKHDYPNIIEGDDTELIETNMEIISKFKQAKENLANKKYSENLQLFNEIKFKLDNENIFSKTEQKSIYYKRFYDFCSFNIKIHEKLATDEKKGAQSLLGNQEKYLKKCPRLKPYFELLQKSVSENKKQSLYSLETLYPLKNKILQSFGIINEYSRTLQDQIYSK
jgi:tRNA A-37 threonylcarbamoyl transferase component Bud32